MTDETQPQDQHFNAVVKYVNWTTAAILAIVVACFFIPIPKDNEKFVDIGLGILLGILSSNSGTVTGSNPPNKKGDLPLATTESGDVNVKQ